MDALSRKAALTAMADDQAPAVMGTLATLVGQLDGLRVGLTQVVAERGLYGQRGARNLVGWLRADARVADDAWKLARLALAAAGLPQVTGLLAAGTVSLSQAATACWQIGQLPDVPRRPQEFGPAGAAPPGPGARGSEPSEMIGSPAPPDLRRSTDDCAAGARDDGVAGEAPPNRKMANAS